MQIHGLQKMTLLDFPGKVACTVFIAGCNMRCPFCHNSYLVTDIKNENAMSTEEVLRFIESRQRILDGVAITGGEPLLYEDVIPFIREIKKMGLSVKLDTNGTFPERLKAVIDEGLVDYVAMDVKNCFERYGETVGVKDFDIAPIKESISLLINGECDYEFRTTVVKQFHSPADIESLAYRIKGAKKYFLQSFVDSGALISSGLSGVEKAKMLDMKRIAAKFVDFCDVRGV